jgi:hypothetical protein
MFSAERCARKNAGRNFGGHKMNRKIKAALAGSIGALLFGAVLLVHAQDAPPPGPPPEAEMLGVEMGGGPHKVVKGAPFSATTNIETTNTLADGTHIDRKSPGAVYRDSMGRTRHEENLSAIGPVAVGYKSGQFVMIHDPVAGTHMVLDPTTKTAQQMPAHGHGGPDAADARGDKKRAKEDSANVTKQDLGTQTIEGVVATGTRITRTIPAGQIGNDKPIQIVTERWFSNDLQVVVKSTHTDPRWGTSTYQLTNINRSEPAASLFQVPADYTVKQGHGGRRGFGGPPPAGAPAPPAPQE